MRRILANVCLEWSWKDNLTVSCVRYHVTDSTTTSETMVQLRVNIVTRMQWFRSCRGDRDVVRYSQTSTMIMVRMYRRKCRKLTDFMNAFSDNPKVTRIPPKGSLVISSPYRFPFRGRHGLYNALIRQEGATYQENNNGRHQRQHKNTCWNEPSIYIWA